MIDREAVVEVLEKYEPSAIRIGTIASHSALDVCDGAAEEGFRTLAVCEAGREAPYARYFRALRDPDGRLVRGCVDEALVLPKFREVLSAKIQDRLRKTHTVFVPNRSFTSYCDLSDIEDGFRVPLFGSRNLLRTEEREEERSYYWLLETAKLPFPEKIEDPKEIDGLVIVKLHHKVKKLERGFFTAASAKEYKEKSDKLLKQGVISKEDLTIARIERYIVGPIFNFDFFYSPIEEEAERIELLGIDWRFETSLDGHVRLPAEQQLTLGEDQRIPEYTVVGHNSATLRESSLRDAFDLAERYVKATQEHYAPGIIGPFTLQTAVDKDLRFYIYDVAPRIGGGTNVHVSVGHPYGNSLWRRPMSTGRRIAMEIRRGIESGRLAELVT
ncbi:MAG TPA: formate--phosphoribosylaminoimidazolecarboxamide ligase family protein [Thermoplasmata archaeon]|nr:formate--phosphoribosylaminoimidazolecarboxamide ligase family protein [Thermoplasmata archaeon]